jgi:hypothetical protein
MNHTYNTSMFTIRTRTEVIATVIGVAEAVKTVENLQDRSGVGVFMDGVQAELEMSANRFLIFGKKMDRLINHNIGWDGKKIA